MYPSQGRSQGHGGGPCRYCLQDAEFSLDIGDTEYARLYEEDAYGGDCMHAGGSQRRNFAILQDQLPPALRLNADPSGRRPCGPSHLTLPHDYIDPRTGQLDGTDRPPAWPAYRHLYDHLYDQPNRVGQTYRNPGSRAPLQHRPSPQGPSPQGPSHHGPGQYGPSRHGPSHLGPSHLGPSRQGPSHDGPSHTDGPLSGGAGIRSPGGRSGLQMGSMTDPRDQGRREASDYGSSSHDYSDSNTESESSFGFGNIFPVHGSGGSRFAGGSQGRSDMGGRRGPR
ncbi:putative global transcription activator SNF2L2 [Pseudocyphellaria aurata]|nr:putative global transcription activator SNF2L2 [Pseudocyphellaria aurata]